MQSMRAGYRILFNETASAVRPAHLEAAVRDLGLRSHAGPPGADLRTGEMAVIKPRDHRASTLPFWNDYEWAPTPGVCPSTFLTVKFTADGATAELLRLRLTRWVP
jgi:hypothetical protein